MEIISHLAFQASSFVFLTYPYHFKKDFIFWPNKMFEAHLVLMLPRPGIILSFSFWCRRNLKPRSGQWVDLILLEFQVPRGLFSKDKKSIF